MSTSYRPPLPYRSPITYRGLLASAGGDVTGDLDTTGIADGTYTLRVTATDSAGATGVAATTITIVNTPAPPPARRALAPLVLAGVTRPRWAVYVRNAQLARVAQIDTYSRLDLVARHNDAGSWALDCPDGTPAARALAAPGAGIVFERNGIVVMSGPCTEPSRARDDHGARTLEATGVDDLAELRRRVAKAQPATAAPPYGIQAADVRTGVASTVILAYIDVNAGPGATPERAIANLTVAADPTIGSSSTRSARYDQLLALVQQIAWASTPEVTVSVTQAGASIVAAVTATRDLTASVVFAIELETLGTFTYSRARADDNYAYAGGAGAGTARTIVEAQDGPSIARDGRAEVFLDQSSTTSTAELTQAALADFAQHAARTALQLVALPAGYAKWPGTWGLGDKVTGLIDGAAYQDRIREIHITVDSKGEHIAPAIGTPNAAPATPLLYRQNRRLAQRISALETMT